MATFDYNAEAELFPPRLRKSPSYDLGTDDLRGLRTPFASQSKSSRPNCFSAPFLRSTVKDMGGEDIRRLYDRADFPSLPQAAA